MAPLLARLGLGRSGFGFGKKSGGVSAGAAPAGITATGGVISDYTDPGPGLSRWRRHESSSGGRRTP